MTASTAWDDYYNVEYYFECTAGGGHDSGWQDNETCRFVCRILNGHKAGALRVSAGGQAVSCKFVQKDSEITIVTEGEVTIEAGRSCQVVLEYS